MRASNGCIEPCSASIDSAAATSAARASRSAPASASAATAVDTCVPLIRARPSFGAERDRRRVRPRRARAAAGVRVAPSQTSPSPISTSAMCASGARSPLAPTDPRLGHARMHAAVERRDQRVERLDANAGEAFGQHIGAQRHRRAHGADRQRLVDAGGVAAQQVDLQLRQIVAVDARFGERAEAGVDAVDRARRLRRARRRRRARRSRAPAPRPQARPRRRRPRWPRARRASDRRRSAAIISRRS